MYWKSARGAWRSRGLNSLRLRLSAAFALIVAAAIGAMGLFLYLSLAAQLDADERARVLNAAHLLQRLVAELPNRSALRAQARRIGDAVGSHGDLRVAVMDPGGAALVGLSSSPWPSERLALEAARGGDGEVGSTADGRYHVLLATAQLGEEQALIGIAHERIQSQQLLSRFAASVLVACAIAALLAWVLGSVAAARGLAPLGKMAQAAKRIGPQRLGERLALGDWPAELREVAQSMNEMLAGLEESFLRLSQFSADLAHELRTPVNNLMLHAQVALGRPRSEAELRAVLESGLEELERLSRMVNHMLFLAKADNAQLALKREPFSLDEEADKALEFFEPLASERRLSLVRRGAARVRADRNLILRVLANLVSNAVRHADEGSTVEVSLAEGEGSAHIAVTNAGRPLLDEECRRVFDRFYRGARSSGSQGEGAGLGLSIVKSIVQLHGGEVAATSAAGRNTFSVRLPV